MGTIIQGIFIEDEYKGNESYGDFLCAVHKLI